MVLLTIFPVEEGKDGEPNLTSEEQEHPADLCMILMFPAMPLFFIYRPGIRQFQELHAGGAVGGVDVGHL